VVHVDQPHLVQLLYPLVEYSVAHLPLHRPKERPGRDGALRVLEGDPRDVLEQVLLFFRKSLHAAPEVHVSGRLERGLDVLPRHFLLPCTFRAERCTADEIDPHAEVSARHGPVDDEVEELPWQHAGIEGPPDPVLEDGVHLVPGVGGKGDLGGRENGHDARVEGLMEVDVHVADREEDSRPDTGVRLVEPKEGVEDRVEQPVREEVIGVVEADGEDQFPVHEAPADPIEDGPGRAPERGRDMAVDAGVDPGEDGEEGPLGLAVHVHGEDPLRRHSGLREYPLDAGRLSRARDAAQDRVQGAGPGEAGLQAVGDLLELRVPERELFRDVIGLEHVAVPEYRMVRDTKCR